MDADVVDAHIEELWKTVHALASRVSELEAWVTATNKRTAERWDKQWREQAGLPEPEAEDTGPAPYDDGSSVL